MARAKVGDMVQVHYTGKLDDGEVFDSSVDRNPLEFSIGAGQVIPGFEEAIVGMEPGQEKTVRIPAEEAYGPHRAEMMLAVDRAEVPPEIEPQVGQQLQLVQPNGQTMIVTVTEVTDQQVTMDANHPLAGKALTFDIRLLEVH